jgi:hypothetical protein
MPSGPALDQYTIDFEPVLLRKRGQSCYSIQLVHISTSIEMMRVRQVRQARMWKATTGEDLPCA